MTAVNAEVAAVLTTLPLRRLTHFTPALNLPNIIADGQLRSTKDLKADVRACYKPTDLTRLDGYPDKICCSLQYPNGFYFDVARGKLANYPDWVCLLLDPQVAAREGTLFCPRNAAGAGQRASGSAGLLACYATSVLGQGGMNRGRGTLHDPGSPTDVQAEVLVTAPTPLSSVSAIVFPTEGAAKEEHGRLERLGLLPPTNVAWVVSAGMFDKVAITAAVRSSRYFDETTWSPIRLAVTKP
jgi:hypothetical protein